MGNERNARMLMNKKKYKIYKKRKGENDSFAAVTV